MNGDRYCRRCRRLDPFPFTSPQRSERKNEGERMCVALCTCVVERRVWPFLLRLFFYARALRVGHNEARDFFASSLSRLRCSFLLNIIELYVVCFVLLLILHWRGTNLFLKAVDGDEIDTQRFSRIDRKINKLENESSADQSVFNLLFLRGRQSSRFINPSTLHNKRRSRATVKKEKLRLRIFLRENQLSSLMNVNVCPSSFFRFRRRPRAKRCLSCIQ